MELTIPTKRKTPGKAIRKHCVACVGSFSDVHNCHGDRLLDGTVCVFYKYRLGKGRPSVKTIRKFCVQCMNGQFALVGDCQSEKVCTLFPYRYGKNPNIQMSEERKEQCIESLKKARESRRKSLSES